MIGIIFASILNLVVIGVMTLFKDSKEVSVVDPAEAFGINPIELGRPPSPVPPQNTKPIGQINRADFSVGAPVAVPDDQAPEEVNIATQDDLAVLINTEPVVDWDDFGENEVIVKDAGGILPSPDSFIFYEERPEIVENIQPMYPPMAQRAGIEGIVWINVLIDRTGKVRNVIIVKESGAQAGFEEAAIEAAYRTVWKPAISNGQPVAVWTTYRIIFELK
jgi:protein TonB